MEPAAQAHWSWLGEFVRRCQVCVDKHASISDATWIVSVLPRSTPTFAQHLVRFTLSAARTSTCGILMKTGPMSTWGPYPFPRRTLPCRAIRIT